MRLVLVQRLIALLLGTECGHPAAASWSIQSVLFLESNRVA